MKELKVTEYRHLKAVALGSRDQLCINEEVLKDASTGSEKVHLCRAKVKAKQCSYHGRVDKALESPEVQNQSVMDIEDLVKTGKSCKACPYYMSKQMSGQADIVFMPYNYVLDPKLLKSFSLKLANAIIILDEAHNVEKVCQDAASVQIASSDIATCMEDLTHIMKILEDNDKFVTIGDDSETDFTVEDCAKLKEIMMALEKEVDEIGQVTSKGRTMPGDEIFNLLSACNITQISYPMTVKLIESMMTFLTESNAGKAFGRKGFGLLKVLDLLGTVYGSMTGDIEDWKKTMMRGYRMHVELEEPKKKGWQGNKTSDGWHNTSTAQTTMNNKAKVINYWCFNPGFGMANLVNRNVHSIILTSGTLTPLRPLISELALDAGYLLENPHIVSKSQVMAKIISQGPDGTVLNGAYSNRNSPKYMSSLGMTIKTIANFTPSGLLVFFPSYSFMNQCQVAWEQTGLWRSINEVKPIFLEPRRKEEFDECMTEYYSAVKTSRGAIFMAVLRGKVSEGLDFKDENGRAVIIAGLPFPPYFDPQVVLKKEYLETTRTPSNQLQSGQSWYNMEATRAVNQAIGRVIRHKDDYGAIFLCDQRFHNYKSGLSKWVQSNIVQKNEAFKFQPVIKELREFFQNAGSTLPMPVRVKVEPIDSIDLSVDQRQEAKVKTEDLQKKLIKIENSNEIYGNGSKRSSADQQLMQEFMKSSSSKDMKPTTFLGGLNKDVSTIDFNLAASTQNSQSQSSLKFSSGQLDNHYESVAKRRKLTMVANKASQEVIFVTMKEPIKVKSANFMKDLPASRGELLEVVSMKGSFENFMEQF